MTVTARQASWTTGFTGVTVKHQDAGDGAVNGQAPGGGHPSGPKPSVKLFADQARTRAWMGKFDEFMHHKGEAIEYNGTRMPGEQFRRQCIFPVGNEIRHAIDTIRKMNGESLRECDSLEGESKAVAVGAVQTSMGKLNNATSSLGGGHFQLAYHEFIGGLNGAMQARAAIATHDEKAIEHADNMVKTLEITRDTGFTLLAFAMPESVAVIAVAGAATKAAEDWASGKDLKDVTFEFVLGIFLNKLGGPAQAAVEGVWKKKIADWLDHAIWPYLEKAATSPLGQKFGAWLRTEGEQKVFESYEAMVAKRSMDPKRAEELIARARKFVLERSVAEKMIEHMVETLKDTLEKIGKVTYGQIVAHDPNLSVKQRCEKFLEELKKEEFKDGKEKMALLNEALEFAGKAI